MSQRMPSHFKDPLGREHKAASCAFSCMFITLNQPCRKTKSASELLERWDAEEEEEEAVEESVSTRAQACSD